MSTERLLNNYTPAAIAAQILASGLLTLIAQALTWALPGLSAPWGGPTPIPWVLLVLSALLLAPTPWVVRHRYGWFPVLHLLQSLAQAAWLLLLCWESAFPISLLAMMQLVGWLFTDVRYVPDRVVRTTWDLILPVFVLELLFLDLFGKGIVSALFLAPAQAIAWLVVIGLGAPFLSWAVRLVLEQQRCLLTLEQENLDRVRRIQAQLAEQRLVQRIGGLLDASVGASRFSHDVASPVFVVLSCVDELDETLGDEAPSLQARLKEPLADLRAAAERLSDMTTTLNRAINGPSEGLRLLTDDLANNAVQELSQEMASRGLVAPDVHVDVEKQAVIGGVGHISAVSNLLVNGALHSEGRPMRIVGRLVGSRYRLDLEDRGVDGDERERALTRIAARLQLTPASSLERSSRYRGQGLGLLLSRLEVLRHGGDIEAVANNDGPGITMRIWLTTDPLDPVTPFDLDGEYDTLDRIPAVT